MRQPLVVMERFSRTLYNLYADAMLDGPEEMTDKLLRSAHDFQQEGYFDGFKLAFDLE